MKTITGTVTFVVPKGNNGYKISIDKGQQYYHGSGRLPALGDSITIAYVEKQLPNGAVINQIMGGEAKARDLPEQIRQVSEYIEDDKPGLDMRAMDTACRIGSAMGSNEITKNVCANIDALYRKLTTGEWE